MTQRICSVEGCDRLVSAKAMCKRHYQQSWRKQNPARKKALDDAWRAAHREEARQKFAIYCKENPDAKAEADRRWRDANRARVSAVRMEWDRNHPDRARDRLRANRAKRKAAFVEPVDTEAIWLRDGGVCGICELPIDRDLKWPDPLCLTLDHIIPLSRGGTHEPSNAQPAHFVCNTRKGNRLSA